MISAVKSTETPTDELTTEEPCVLVVQTDTILKELG